MRNAAKKYGKESFRMSIIHWCDNKNDANELETFLISECNTIANGYNITPGGDGTGSGESNPFFGKTHSEETKEKLRAVNLGRKLSEEHILKLTEGRKAKGFSEEAREKLRNRPISKLCSERTSISNKNRVWTQESKDKLRKANIGKKHSDAAKSKIGVANSVRIWTDESRAKLSESAKARHAKNKSTKMG